MANPKSQPQPTEPSPAHYKNDFGADLWVRNKETPQRHATAGRGLFAGLQDTKKYNVDSGWAKRNADNSSGLGGWIWNKMFGGNYKPPGDN